MRNLLKVLILAGFLSATPAWAQQKAADTKSQPQTGNKGAIITKSSTIPPAKPAPEAKNTQTLQQIQPSADSVDYKQALRAAEEVRYTLGPEDTIQVVVQRHPEFSGTFPVNLEGKIQMGFVGDIDVTGYTKKELEAKISGLVATYVVNPEVNITILEYRSKYYLVIGEVNRPGRYFMRSETTTVKDAIVEAGLPMISAAMRKCRVITPDKNGRVKTRSVDIYAILYGGNLKKNLEMHPGDTLYVPSTIMAKTFRVIAPITEPVTSAAGAQTGVNTMRNRPTP
jgi:polysaccharide biosynthesis/export protein